jgi:hypothetical protein
MANNPRHKENLRKPWKKGESGNPKGAPPKVFTDMERQFKAEGYNPVTLKAISEAYQMLLALPEEKLKEILIDKNQPVIFKMIIKGMTSGKAMEIIERMLDRVHGKPTQAVKSTIDISPESIVGFNVIINKAED